MKTYFKCWFVFTELWWNSQFKFLKEYETILLSHQVKSMKYILYSSHIRLINDINRSYPLFLHGETTHLLSCFGNIIDIIIKVTFPIRLHISLIIQLVTILLLFIINDSVPSLTKPLQHCVMYFLLHTYALYTSEVEKFWVF